MEPKYKEPAVKTPTAAQLTEIASQLGFDLGPAEIQEYKEVISESLLATYQRLNEIPDPKLPVKYPRTPGYRPSGEDNPCNAW